jgi:hypothetical protein
MTSTTTSSHNGNSAMQHAQVGPDRARGCQCEYPWRGDDTCLRCGRSVPQAVRHAPRQHRSHVEGNPWTRAGVVRALRTYEFFVGRAPTTTDWSFEDDMEWPSVRTVEMLFGGFAAAVAAAGVTPARS